jgi:hypothetical protein
MGSNTSFFSGISGSVGRDGDKPCTSVEFSFCRRCNRDSYGERRSRHSWYVQAPGERLHGISQEIKVCRVLIGTLQGGVCNPSVQ